MGPQASADTPPLFCVGTSAATNVNGVVQLAPMPGQWQPGDSVLCGQSRTTIKARHFASLIGRLWVGGY
jgi:hypothetical protein